MREGYEPTLVTGVPIEKMDTTSKWIPTETAVAYALRDNSPDYPYFADLPKGISVFYNADEYHGMTELHLLVLRQQHKELEKYFKDAKFKTTIFEDDPNPPHKIALKHRDFYTLHLLLTFEYKNRQSQNILPMLSYIFTMGLHHPFYIYLSKLTRNKYEEMRDITIRSDERSFNKAPLREILLIDDAILRETMLSLFSYVICACKNYSVLFSNITKIGLQRLIQWLNTARILTTYYTSTKEIFNKLGDFIISAFISNKSPELIITASLEDPTYLRWQFIRSESINSEIKSRLSIDIYNKYLEKKDIDSANKFLDDMIYYCVAYNNMSLIHEVFQHVKSLSVSPEAFAEENIAAEAGIDSIYKYLYKNNLKYQLMNDYWAKFEVGPALKNQKSQKILIEIMGDSAFNKLKTDCELVCQCYKNIMYDLGSPHHNFSTSLACYLSERLPERYIQSASIQEALLSVIRSWQKDGAVNFTEEPVEYVDALLQKNPCCLLRLFCARNPYKEFVEKLIEAISPNMAPTQSEGHSVSNLAITH